MSYLLLSEREKTLPGLPLIRRRHSWKHTTGIAIGLCRSIKVNSETESTEIKSNPYCASRGPGPAQTPAGGFGRKIVAATQSGASKCTHYGPSLKQQNFCSIEAVRCMSKNQFEVWYGTVWYGGAAEPSIKVDWPLIR